MARTLLVLGLSALAGLLLACGAAAPTKAPPGAAGSPTQAASPGTGSNAGDRAPEFALHLVDGSTVTGNALREREHPVFLFFWATW